MEKKTFDEVCKNMMYAYVENTNEKEMSEIADELREQIRSMGWDCLDEGKNEDDWGAADGYELSHVADYECVAYDYYTDDLVMGELHISFFGKWGEEGVFMIYD